MYLKHKRTNSYLNPEEAIDEFEVSDFQKLMKKFDLDSSTKSSNIFLLLRIHLNLIFLRSF